MGALGDFVYKTSSQLPAEQQQVSPEPEFVVHERDAAKDQYLVLACDGIWDVMENEQVGEYIKAKVAAGVDDMGELADMLIRECLALGSRDNMSVVLVELPAAPKPTAEAVAQHKAAVAKRAREQEAAAAAEGGK